MMGQQNCQLCNCEIEENGEICKECNEHLMQEWDREKRELEKFWRDTRL